MASNLNYSIKISADVAGKAQVDALQRALQSLGATNIRVGSDASSNVSGVQSLTSSLGSLKVALAAAAAAALAVGAAMKKGFDASSEIEDAQLGVKAIIASLADIKDANGKLAKGPEALAIAAGIAQDQVEKLRVAGMQTAAEFKDLLGAFQAGLGPGMAAGLGVDNVREITVSLVQAAGAFKLQGDQLASEVRAIFSGDQLDNSQIAQALSIKKEDLDKWKEQGKLAEELNKKLVVFKLMAPEIGATWSATMSNMADAFALFMRNATGGAFDTLKKSLQDAMGQLFDSDANISEAFSGITDAANGVFSAIGDELASAIAGAVSLAKELSDWFNDSKTVIGETASAFGVVWDQLKGALGTVFEIVGAVAKWVVDSGLLRDTFRMIAVFVAMVRDIFKGLSATMADIGGAVIDYIGKPLRSVLTSLRDFVSSLPYIGKSMASAIDIAVRSIPENGDKLRAYSEKVKADFKEGRTYVAQAMKDLEGGAKKTGATDAKTAPKGTATGRKKKDDDKKGKADTSADALAKAQQEAELTRFRAQQDALNADLDKALATREITQRAYIDRKEQLDLQAAAKERSILETSRDRCKRPANPG